MVTSNENSDAEAFSRDKERAREQALKIARETEKPLTGIQARIDAANLKKKVDEEVKQERQDTGK